MPPKRFLFFCLAIALLTLAVPAGAQDKDTTRDPWSLARRLLGFDADFAIPAPTPLYVEGDSADFWIAKPDADRPTKITARLAAATPDLYLWVENGVPFKADAMLPVAAQLSQILTTLRLRSVYGDPTIIPNVGTVADPTSLIQMSDVDHDPHLFVVFVDDLGSLPYIVNSSDELPVEIAPGGYSNQHEMIAINVAILPNTPLDNAAYSSITAKAMYEMLADYHTPGQDQWLKEALGILLARLLQLPDVHPDAPSSFMGNPNTRLITPFSATPSLATGGAQQAFLDYAIQRFGFPFLQHVFQQPGQGLAPFDAAFTEGNLTDPVSGQIVTSDEFFADFTAATAATYLVSELFGDGRYVHQMADLPANQPPGGVVVRDNLNFEIPDAPAAQYGTAYVYVGSTKVGSFSMTFDGQPETPLLPLPADDQPGNHFYWSGNGQNQDTTITKTFNLAGLDQATLAFDVWYDMPTALNYAYAEVSTDGGATWSLLAGDLRAKDNHNGLAYGPGYSGISSRAEPTPYPIMGVLFAGDGITVQDITADGPASSSDLQKGDVIIGYDGHPWQEPPDIVGLLGNYNPGDTVNLFVQRGNQTMTIPVVLGAHPTRVKPLDPVWVHQEVDLSPFVGQEVMLRFEYVSQPQGGGYGMAVDNIAIPELDYLDDAEGTQGWTLNGWQQVENQVAQKFLVQYISSGTQNKRPRVRPLIAPGGTATSGEWHFDIDAQEVVVFAISGLNNDTTLPAQFALKLAQDVGP